MKPLAKPDVEDQPASSADAVPLREQRDFPESYARADLCRRRDGWTAERRHIFLASLAATGCVAIAADTANITPRSAYRLRNHVKGAAFARAWDAALLTAANRLTTIAFERAILGTPREVWRDGVMVAQTSIPSDRMLMFLLKHLNPQFFAPDPDPAKRAAAIDAAQASYPATMAALVDVDVDGDLLRPLDYMEQPPREQEA